MPAIEDTYRVMDRFDGTPGNILGHVTEDGSNWLAAKGPFATAAASQMTVASSHLTCTAGAQNAVLVTRPPRSPDQLVHIEPVWPRSESGSVYLLARWDDSGAHPTGYAVKMTRSAANYFCWFHRYYADGINNLDLQGFGGVALPDNSSSNPIIEFSLINDRLFLGISGETMIFFEGGSTLLRAGLVGFAMEMNNTTLLMDTVGLRDAPLPPDSNFWTDFDQTQEILGAFRSRVTARQPSFVPTVDPTVFAVEPQPPQPQPLTPQPRDTVELDDDFVGSGFPSGWTAPSFPPHFSDTHLAAQSGGRLSVPAAAAFQFDEMWTTTVFSQPDCGFKLSGLRVTSSGTTQGPDTLEFGVRFQNGTGSWIAGYYLKLNLRTRASNDIQWSLNKGSLDGGSHSFIFEGGSGTRAGLNAANFSCELRLVGQLMSVYFNDVLVFSLTDDGTIEGPIVPAAGRAYLYLQNGANGSARDVWSIDRATVTTFPPPPPSTFWTDFDQTTEIVGALRSVIPRQPSFVPTVDPTVFVKEVQPPQPQPLTLAPILVLNDTFTGSGDITGHTGESGHTWAYSTNLYFRGFSPRNAGFTLVSNAVRLDTTGFNKYAAVVSNAAIASADGYMEARIVGSSMKDMYAGFGIRYTEATGAGIFFGLNGGDASHQYFFVEAWRGGADPGISIVDGADGSTPGLPAANPNNYLLRLEFEGAVLRIYIDGVLGYTTSAAYVTAPGTVGFWLDAATPASGTVSSVEAGTLGPPPPSTFWTDFDQTQEIVPP